MRNKRYDNYLEATSKYQRLCVFTLNILSLFFFFYRGDSVVILNTIQSTGSG